MTRMTGLTLVGAIKNSVHLPKEEGEKLLFKFYTLDFTVTFYNLSSVTTNILILRKCQIKYDN